MNTHPQDPFEMFPSWKPIASVITLLIGVLLVGYFYVLPGKSPTSNKQSFEATLSRFTGQYNSVLENGISLPPTHEKEARSVARIRLTSIFVASHEQYFSTSTIGGPVSLYFIENTEFLSSHSNAKIILSKLESFSLGKTREVAVNEISPTRLELVYVFGSRVGAVDFVTENGITRLDYLTAAAECKTRNETIRKTSKVILPCNIYPKYITEASTKANK